MKTSLLAILAITTCSPLLAQDKKPEYGVRVVKSEADGLRKVAVRNSLKGPITVTIKVALINAEGRGHLDDTIVIPPSSQRELFSLRALDPQKPWDYKLNAQWRHGDLRAKHKATGYRLPFRAGERFRMTQGTGWSHRGPARHAVDFAMPIGSAICAARAGKVVFVFDGYTESGREARLMNRGNAILIAHDDGTVAKYGHLDTGGARVKLGQAVTAGQLIALSGNTGYSGQPHLHFEVFQPVSGTKIESLPLRFFDHSGKAKPLIAGVTYGIPVSSQALWRSL